MVAAAAAAGERAEVALEVPGVAAMGMAGAGEAGAGAGVPGVATETGVVVA